MGIQNAINSAFSAAGQTRTALRVIHGINARNAPKMARKAQESVKAAVQEKKDIKKNQNSHNRLKKDRYKKWKVIK